MKKKKEKAVEVEEKLDEISEKLLKKIYKRIDYVRL